MTYRKEDLAELTHLDGASPPLPLPHEELEPYYCQTEQFFGVEDRIKSQLSADR